MPPPFHPMILSFFFLFLAGCLIIASAAPFSRCQAWWIRWFEFPRLQFAIGAGLLALLALIFLDLAQWQSWATMVASGLCFGVQAWWVIPYTRLKKVEVRNNPDDSDCETLSILTANVLTSNRQSDRLLELVRQHQPDILVTLESNPWWQEQLDALEDEGYEDTLKCPLDNLYGMHVYSKLPLSECETRFLVEPDIPSMHALAHLPSGREVRVHFLHPSPPGPAENEESSERDAEIVMVARSVAKTTLPVVVAGDLNDVGWSATTRLFRKISGLLDPRIGRGMFSTYHASYWFMRWPLDHLFHSDHFTLQKIMCLPAFGSDHFPLLTVLAMDPRRSNGNGFEPDSEDRETADELLESEGVKEGAVPKPGIDN